MADGTGTTQDLGTQPDVTKTPPAKPADAAATSADATRVTPAATAPKPTPDPDVIAAAKRETDELRAKLAAETQARQKLEDANALAERRRLEEEGKFKELAERETKRALAAEERTATRESELQAQLSVAELKARLAIEGVADPDYYMLADRTKLKYENGALVGLDECIRDLKERKPHIFKQPPASTTTTVVQPAPIDKGGDVGKADVTKMTDEQYRDFKRGYIRGLARRA